MLTKLCGGCGKIIPYGIAYCDQCAKAKNEQKKANISKTVRKYTRVRDKRIKAFYDSGAWIMLSRKTLAENEYRCAECNGIATEVHHTLFLSTPEGWAHRLDEKILLCLCHNCHDKAHSRFCKTGGG